MSLQADIIDDMGDYVELHKDSIVEQMMTPYKTAAECTTIYKEAQEKNVIGIPQDQLGEVVQNFQPVFTEKGDLQSFANTTTQRRHKINVRFIPDDIVGKWEAFIKTKGYDETKARSEMPITKYILGKIFQKIDEDRETQMIYRGVYVEKTANVASPAIQAVDGFGKILADLITADKIDPFPMGAYTPSTTFEYIEALFKAVPELYRYNSLKLYMSQDTLHDYSVDKRNTFNYRLNMSEILGVDFSNIQMVALPSMAGKKRIIATVPGNWVRILHKNNSATNLDVKEDDYYVKIKGDWHECYGIASNDLIWCNDQV